MLLVGGEGTRLRPLTEWLPKPMLPIANRPFLEHQIGQLRGHGIDRVVLVVRVSCPSSIREYFGDTSEVRGRARSRWDGRGDLGPAGEHRRDVRGLQR